MLDLQKYLNAPTQLDPQGNYTYIQNPDSGQWEIAHYLTLNDGVPYDPEGNPGAYNPEAGGTPANWGRAPTVITVPRSVAQQISANPSLAPNVTNPDWQTSVVQQSRGGGVGLEDFLVPALMTAAGFGLPGFGPAAGVSQATGLGPVASSALTGGFQAGLQGGNPLTGALTSGATAAAWPYLPSLPSTSPVASNEPLLLDSGSGGVSDVPQGLSGDIWKPQVFSGADVGIGSDSPLMSRAALGLPTAAAGGGIYGGGVQTLPDLGGFSSASVPKSNVATLDLTKGKTGDPQMWDWLNEITGANNDIAQFGTPEAPITTNLPSWGSSWAGSVDNPGLFDPSTPGFQEFQGGGTEDWLRRALGLGGLGVKGLLSGDSSGDSLGGSILKSIFGDSGGGLLGAAFNSTPFLLALSEANKQGGDIKNTIGDYRALVPQYQGLGTNAGNLFGDLNSRLRTLSGTTTGGYDTLLGDVTGNESPFVTSVVNPLREQQAAGYGNLLQSQALRGIRGSSFGDQSAANFLTDTGRGISDATAKALESSYGLRSNLLGARDAAARSALSMEGTNLGAANQASLEALQGQSGLFGKILGAQNAANTSRNLLLGAGLSASGRLFQPANPFNLQSLLNLGGAF